MNEPLARFADLMRTPLGRLEVLAVGVMAASAAAIAASVAYDFAVYGRRSDIRFGRAGVVATATMSAFFALLYLLLRYRVWEIAVPSVAWRVAMVVAGLVAIATGCLVNIAGRLELGRNWANQVVLYGDQTLAVGGVYALVRHPLYASLIWMCLGAALSYANAAAALATALVFTPLMYLRARQEEAALRSAFPQYAEYSRNVGMFFPRIRRTGREATTP